MANINRISLPSGSAYDLQTPAILYGEVDSTSTSTAFTATVPGITELYDGVCVYLKNGVVTSASGWTLDINNLGAKPVYQNLAAASRVTTLFNINYTMMFIYNNHRTEGGGWDMFYGYNANDNTVGYYIRANQAIYYPAKTLYRYQILFTTADGTLLPANTSSNTTGTTKVLSTESFDPWGDIYYYSTTTSVGTTTLIGTSYLWSQYQVDLRYAFNKGSTLTIGDPVYVKCSPQSDGLVKFAGNDCIVQALPSTEDGYVYIYLGQAYSASNIYLLNNHPVYYFSDGAIREWTNVNIPAGFNVSIVSTLPTTNIDSHTIYLLSKSATVGSSTVGDSTVGGENDTYDEYIYVNNAWEKLGDDINTEAFARVEDIPTKVSDLTDDVGMITEWTQSDWNEDDTSDPAHVVNRPAIRASDGENSIVEGKLDNYSNAQIYIIYITGAANSLTYTFTTNEESFPTATNLINRGVCSYLGAAYFSIADFDSVNRTITLNRTLSNKAVTSQEIKIYYYFRTANGTNSHAEGSASAFGTRAHAEGDGKALGANSHAEGSATIAEGTTSHSEGSNTKAIGNGSHAEGYHTIAVEKYSHAEGYDTTASGNYSHSENYSTKASGANSHSEGFRTISSGDTSHAEGVGGTASGLATHVEGGWGSQKLLLTGEAGTLTYTVGTEWEIKTTIGLIGASVNTTNDWGSTSPRIVSVNVTNNLLTSITLDKTLNASSAVSQNYYINISNKATGSASHAEGSMTIASGSSAHSEGFNTWAGGNVSHAEGQGNYASGYVSHTEGYYTTASGDASHAEGNQTIANHLVQHVFGEFNIEDPSTAAATTRGNYIEIIGNGTANDARSNARTLDWSGNEILAGKLTVGAGPTNNMDVATKQYVDSAISEADDSDIFWVHFTDDSESLEQYRLVADKTFAELTAAWSSGKLIQATYYGAVYQISNTFDGGYENFAEFKRPINVSSDSGITSVSYNTIDWEHQENNDTIYYIGGQAYTPSIAYPSYPGFSNGQILQYNSTSGKWEATNLPSIPTVSISMSNNVITLSQGGVTTSTIALPVYSGSVSTVGGGS